MIRMTDNFAEDASSWRGRVLLVKYYGYRSYDYFYFGFADNYSANNNF